jgi:hypothetical protein
VYRRSSCGSVVRSLYDTYVNFGSCVLPEHIRRVLPCYSPKLRFVLVFRMRSSTRLSSSRRTANSNGWWKNDLAFATLPAPQYGCNRRGETSWGNARRSTSAKPFDFPGNCKPLRVYNVCPASQWTFKLSLVQYLAFNSPTIMRVQGMLNMQLE